MNDVVKPVGEAIIAGIQAVLEAEQNEVISEMAGSRFINKFIVNGPTEAPLATFEVGQPYPGLETSLILGMFDESTGKSLPGDVRMYVIPGPNTPPSDDTVGYRCYTINRQLLGVAPTREQMTREVFVDSVVEEWVRILDDEDEPEDEEEDGLVCLVAECNADAVYQCTCVVCRNSEEGPYLSCGDHRHVLDPEHMKEQHRPAIWKKLPELDVPISLVPAGPMGPAEMQSPAGVNGPPAPMTLGGTPSVVEGIGMVAAEALTAPETPSAKLSSV
jgi:hypothetical protein